jgi:hypothetical protein
MSFPDVLGLEHRSCIMSRDRVPSVLCMRGRGPEFPLKELTYLRARIHCLSLNGDLSALGTQYGTFCTHSDEKSVRNLERCSNKLTFFNSVTFSS